MVEAHYRDQFQVLLPLPDYYLGVYFDKLVSNIEGGHPNEGITIRKLLQFHLDLDLQLL